MQKKTWKKCPEVSRPREKWVFRGGGQYGQELGGQGYPPVLGTYFALPMVFSRNETAFPVSSFSVLGGVRTPLRSNGNGEAPSQIGYRGISLYPTFTKQPPFLQVARWDFPTEKRPFFVVEICNPKKWLSGRNGISINIDKLSKLSINYALFDPLFVINLGVFLTCINIFIHTLCDDDDHHHHHDVNLWWFHEIINYHNYAFLKKHEIRVFLKKVHFFNTPVFHHFWCVSAMQKHINKTCYVYLKRQTFQRHSF